MLLEEKWLLLELFLRGIRKMSTIKTETLITTGEATFGLNLDQRTDREKNEFK